MITLTKNEQQLLISALTDKCQAQYKKLMDAHLDQKYVTLYQQIHTDLISLQVKILRATPDVEDVVISDGSEENSGSI